MKTRTSQGAEYLRKPWGLFSTKLNATANKLGREKTQIKCYKDIHLTGNWHKIC